MLKASLVLSESANSYRGQFQFIKLHFFSTNQTICDTAASYRGLPGVARLGVARLEASLVLSDSANSHRAVTAACPANPPRRCR